MASIISGISSLISNAGSGASKLYGSVSNASYLLGTQQVQAEMQQNSLDKMRLDAENQRISGLADSAAQAGSAASQIKIQY